MNNNPGKSVSEQFFEKASNSKSKTNTPLIKELDENEVKEIKK